MSDNKEKKNNRIKLGLVLLEVIYFRISDQERYENGDP